MASFFTELKRRNVFKVGVAYAIVAWLLIQIVVAVETPLNLPNWVDTFTILVLMLGSPVSLIIAWAFELTPEGIKTSKSVDPADSIRLETGQKLNYVIIGVMALAILFLVIDNYVLEDVSPSDEVITTTEPAASEEATTRNRRSIAVLPFANRSNNEDDAFFVDGVHDETLSHLARISSLKVISRTSVMAYRDTDKNLRTIGEELRVATILEGSVQRAGDQIRIIVQLIDATTDEHLWTETYDRVLSAQNIFAIQTEMSNEIANALQATLSPSEQERLSTVPTENMAALEAYFRGRQEMASRASEGLASAIEYYQQTIDLDPGFALAYVGLADATGLQTLYTGLSWEERSPMIETAINQALALDDELGEAYAALGFLKNYTGELEASESAFQRAIVLSPNYATAYHWYGDLLSFFFGRSEEALVLYDQALELDPNSAIIMRNRAISLQELGRFDEAWAQHEQAVEKAPSLPIGYSGMGRYHYFVSGRLDEAARWYQQLALIDADTPLFNFFHTRILLDLGDAAQVECWASHTREIAPESGDTYLIQALLHLYRGEEVQAFEFADRAMPLISSYIKLKTDLNLPILRDYYIRQGDMAAARALYATYHPELLAGVRPVIGFRNYQAAVDLALVLQKTGEVARAEALLVDSLAYIQSHSRLGMLGYGIKDVEAYALLGDSARALTALRQAIDAGWRKNWRYHLEMNPNLDSIHDDPAFQTMVNEVRADMAAQLARVKAMTPVSHVCSGA